MLPKKLKVWMLKTTHAINASSLAKLKVTELSLCKSLNRAMGESDRVIIHRGKMRTLLSKVLACRQKIQLRQDQVLHTLETEYGVTYYE